MNTTRSRKGTPRTRQSVPDAKHQRARLHARLEKEQVALARWQKRLVRTFHAYERQHRRVGRLERNLSKLDAAGIASAK